MKPLDKKRFFFFKEIRFFFLGWGICPQKSFLVFHMGQELLHINSVVWWEKSRTSTENFSRVL